MIIQAPAPQRAPLTLWSLHPHLPLILLPCLWLHQNLATLLSLWSVVNLVIPLLQVFLPVPKNFLALAGKLGGSNLSGIDRIKRAWTAGQWAKAVVDSRIKTPNRSVQLDLRPRFYAVVRAPRILSPTLCHSAAAYWRIVGKIQENDSISHAFPSEVEAKIYFAGASISTFEVEQ